ncbi:MAB_1171c family putative transporter [Streptomyces cellulosae]
MTATPDLAAWFVVALLTAEVIRRYPSSRRSHRSRTLWLVFLALDLSMITKIEPVGDALYRLTGFDEIPTLVKHLIGIAAVALLLRWVADVVPGRMDGRREPLYRRLISSRPRRIATWLSIAFTTAIFPLSHRRTGAAEDSEFIFVQAGHFWGSLHLLLFYAYLVFGLICAALMCQAAAATPRTRTPFVWGMECLALGCFSGALYGILRSGYLVTRLFDKPFLGGDGFVDVASTFSLVGCVVLVLVGVTAPKWERVSNMVKHHSAINDLRPLWSTLTAVEPGVVYDDTPVKLARDVTGRTRDFWNWRNLDTRLRSRIQEILDAANIQLAPYMPSCQRERAEEIGRELALEPHVVTAYLLREAIRRKQADEEPSDGAIAPLLAAGDDLLSTTARLLPVCSAMSNTAALGPIYRRLSREVQA